MSLKKQKQKSLAMPLEMPSKTLGDILYRKLTPKQFAFLTEYAKDLDELRAARDAGYKSVSSAVSSQAVCDEMRKIERAANAKLLMTAERANARHLDILGKLEGKLDEGEVSVSSSLVKASELYMRASGSFEGRAGASGPAITVNINLGDTQADVTKVIDADFEVKEG